MSQPLTNLSFVDLYICIKGDAPAHYRTRVKGTAKHPDILVPPEFHEDLQKLTTQLQTLENDMVIIDYNGMRLRTAFIENSNGEKWAALRRVKDKPPLFDSLGFPPGLVPHLKNLGKKDGLILVCGATGQGKTTTCCSLLVDYMENYGGVAFTIEDPVEYNLSGRHGTSGFCYQVEVHQDHEWADNLRKSLRCHPRYIFIGEVSTPDAANQLLRAATSGHLVIATVHAGSLMEGLEGLLQLAEQGVGERAKQLLASSVTAIIYQSMGQFGLVSHFLISDFGGQGPAIRSYIRENEIARLSGIAERQETQLAQQTQNTGPAAAAAAMVDPKTKK